MRKDLRLGLGIGALATVFAVTFLVVRNHTQKQAAADKGPQSPEIGACEVGHCVSGMAINVRGALRLGSRTLSSGARSDTSLPR